MVVTAARKAEMGVGTLIVFIAFLLVAAVAAGVLISTAGSLQERALATGDQSEDQIATHAVVVEVSATNGIMGVLNNFTQVMKLAAGSEPIKLENTLLTINTVESTATLRYRGVGASLELGNDGFNTYNQQTLLNLSVFQEYLVDNNNPYIYQVAPRNLILDLDGDSAVDTVEVCDNDGPCPGVYSGTHLRWVLSSAGIIYTELKDPAGATADVSNAGAIPVAIFNNYTAIGEYGYFHIQGTTEQDFAIRGWAPGIQMFLYNMPETLNEDFDDDGNDDALGINQTHAVFFISNNAPAAYMGAHIAIPLGVSIINSGAAVEVNEDISDSGVTYGHLDISGTTTADNSTIGLSINITPEELGKGYFVVEYLNMGSNFVEGNIGRGDVVKIYYESPGDIGEDAELRINLIPKIGTPTLTKFVTPDVISTERVYLYP